MLLTIYSVRFRLKLVHEQNVHGSIKQGNGGGQNDKASNTEKWFKRERITARRTTSVRITAITTSLTDVTSQISLVDSGHGASLIFRLEFSTVTIRY